MKTVVQRRTKIIATLGPASESPAVLRQLILAGLNVARFNMSHGAHSEHKRRIEVVRQISAELGLPVGILLDTKGPEVRVGVFRDGHADIADGQTYTFTTTEIVGDNQRAFSNYANLHEELQPGHIIMVNDGLLQFEVKSVSGHDIVCECLRGGTISDRKAMNFPKLTLKMPFVSEQDRADLIFGCHEQVDFVAASFVSCRENVEEVRALLRANGGGDIDIIAKIENFDGVANIKSILQVSDGIMVARGDLGVEIPFVELPRIQKSLIQSARQLGRRVIVATEMLESMIQKPRPTRAEVSDVANAVIDGASAIMLSGETAAGKFPVDCMKVMSDIATEAEKSLDYHERLKSLETVVKDLSDATCHAAAVAAHDLNAKMIIVFTRTGQSARMVSRFRPEIPVIAATHDKRGYTKVTLSWGVYPVFVSEAKSSHDLFKVAERCALENGCRPGDRIIITVGYPLSGPTNTMRIIEIEAA